MEKDFAKIATRAAALRLTVNELIDQTDGLSRPTYWRAERGHSKLPAVVRVLRRAEQELDRLEAERR